MSRLRALARLLGRRHSRKPVGYPRGQSHASHAFRTSGPVCPSACFYCGLGEIDPYHAAFRKTAVA